MIRLIFLIIIIICILLILKNKSKINQDSSKSKKYNLVIFSIIFLSLLFILATSGKIFLPQILNLLKVSLPFLTKLIGV